MSKKILLIGGAGYIGCVLTRYFLDKDYLITSLDNLIYKNDQTFEQFKSHKNFKFILGDLRNQSLMGDLLDECDFCIILAGLVGDPITKKYPDLAESINYNGISNIINLSLKKKINKFIFVSTCSNYGLNETDKLLNENAELKPLSLYAKHKVAIEKKILSLKGESFFSPTILRFSTAFGLSSRMRFDLTINQFTKSIFQKEKLVVFDANTWRPYCHVKDFARALETVLLATKKNTEYQVFNVGGDTNNYTKKQIVEKISRFIPNKEVEFTNKTQDARNYKVDFSKIKKILNFEIKYSVEDGIKEIIEYLKKNKINEDKKNSKYGNYVIGESNAN